MRIEPTNPFHISRAYQTAPPKQAPAPTSEPIAGSIRPAEPSTRIVAAVVPGRVNFAGAEPQQSGAPLPMYRHPADRNAAATAINAGRNLDIEA